jgi:signal transduction histidine kinase
MGKLKRWYHYWIDPNKYIPLLIGIIFIGGLVFTAIRSNLNSASLLEIQNNTYPLLQKTTLLKIKVKSIQTQFYYAITQEDWDAFLRVEMASSELMDLLKETEGLIGDKRYYSMLESQTLEYIQLSNRVGEALIQKSMKFESSRPWLTQLSQKAKEINEMYDQLNKLGEQEFTRKLIQSREDSLLILRVEMGSVVLGLIIVGGFLWYILFLNKRLLESNDKLERKVKELEAFVYTVSHDLKSPVVSMQGMASLFKKDYGNTMDEKGIYYIDRIIANAGFMEELIQGLLLLSRAGRKSEKMEMAHVSKVIQDILMINQESYKSKNVVVTVEKNLPDAIFERTQLQQIFQNLISNSVKFTGDQAFPKITIGGWQDKDRFEYYVKDNGIGIDPAYHKKVFGVFQRLEDVAVEGTGIGLSIVKKIIDLAGGEIWVESEKGKGATFFFTLPKNIS